MSLRRRLGLGQATLAAVAVDLLSGLATVIATPRLVRALGPAGYGIIGLLSVVAGQLGVLQLGVGPAATRLVAERRGEGDAVGREATVRAALLLALGAALVVVAVFVALARRSLRAALHGTPLVLDEALRALPAGLVVVMMQPLWGALQGVLLGDERFGAAALARLAQGLLRPAAALASVALGGGVAEVLAAQGAVDVGLVASGLLLALRRPRSQAAGRPPTVAELWRAARALVPLGAQFACLGAVTALVLDAEKLVLTLVRSVADLTYYTVPYGVILRVAALGGALGGVLLPRLSFAGAARDPALPALVARAQRLTLALMTVVLTGLLALAPELLRLWLGADFAAQATRPARILLCAMAANAAGLIPGAVLRARSRVWTIVLLYGAQIPLHLVLVAVLVRRYGIPGAAAAWGLRTALDTLAERALAERALGARLGTLVEVLLPSLLLTALALSFETHAAPLWARLVGGGLLSGFTLCWLLQREDLRALLRSAGLGR